MQILFWSSVVSPNNFKPYWMEMKAVFHAWIWKARLTANERELWCNSLIRALRRTSLLHPSEVSLHTGPGTEAVSHAKVCQAAWRLWCRKPWVCKAERQVSYFSVPLSCPSPSVWPQRGDKTKVGMSCSGYIHCQFFADTILYPAWVAGRQQRPRHFTLLIKMLMWSISSRKTGIRI